MVVEEGFLVKRKVRVKGVSAATGKDMGYSSYKFTSEAEEGSMWITFKGPETVASDLFGHDVNAGDWVSIYIEPPGVAGVIKMTLIRTYEEGKMLKRKGLVNELKAIYHHKEKAAGTERAREYRLNIRLYEMPEAIPEIGQVLYISPLYGPGGA